MTESDKYEVLEKIGHGSFGVIRKVRRKHDGQILCRKEISYLKMSLKEREQLHAEFAILSSLHHPNIVGYYHREHLKSSQDLHLYMEYCGNGDLGRVIENLTQKNEYAEENFVWSMFSQLVTALYRCHYGVDPPGPGCNTLGLGNNVKPKQAAGGVMILHRDLKPENVFLGEDNSVKLGDFGLSKIMQSQDFASTYVGTPFYMSPEICAAERYTLKSDIWSLGCIMYELCSRQPPFNAKTHFQLIQKIKEGRINPLPNIYSSDLKRVINSCLIVNPDRRPDTAALLNIPAINLMRKERELLNMSREVEKQQKLVAKKLQEIDERARNLDTEKAQMRNEIDTTVRREWEVKAQLEINRLVEAEIERLQKRFEQEVRFKVSVEVERRENIQNQSILQCQNSSEHLSDSSSSGTHESQFSTLSANGDSEFSNSTEISEIAVDSPEPTKPLRMVNRTPFSRAKTMFAETPMDVDMIEPSPISIASLSLSPRRNVSIKIPSCSRNIFAAAAAAEARWQPTQANSESEDEDDLPPVPSPTRSKSLHKPSRGDIDQTSILASKSLATQRKNSCMTLSGEKTIIAQTIKNAPDLHPKTSHNTLLERSNSPTRRISRIPSSTNINSHEQSPVSLKRNNSLRRLPQNDELNKIATKNMTIKNSASNTAPRGRTLVELAQARAGGRNTIDANRNIETKIRTLAARIADKSGEPTIWDPDRDEMPSPFLIRARAPGKR